MKYHKLLFILFLLPFPSLAQFIGNGSHLYHLNGNVGIGVDNPLNRFHVVDGTGVLRTTDNGDGMVLTSFDHLKSIGLSSSGNGNYGGTGAVGLKLFDGEVKYYFEGIEKVTFKSDGKVGIGTSNPLSKLHIEGDIRITRLGSAGLVSKIIVMGTKATNTGTVQTAFRSGTGDGASFDSWNGGLSSWFGIGFHSDFDNTTRGVFNTRNGDFSIKGKFSSEGTGSNYFAGRVGIGTNTPDAKLTVSGKIHSREVKVTVNAGADHVLQDNYHLLELKKLEDFIKENKHLPEIPSEKEMLENGLEVGKFQIKLLQKVEELTLYIINQHKLLVDVMQKNEKLEKRIETLEN